MSKARVSARLVAFEFFLNNAALVSAVMGRNPQLEEKMSI